MKINVYDKADKDKEQAERHAIATYASGPFPIVGDWISIGITLYTVEGRVWELKGGTLTLFVRKEENQQKVWE